MTDRKAVCYDRFWLYVIPDVVERISSSKYSASLRDVHSKTYVLPVHVRISVRDFVVVVVLIVCLFVAC